MLKGHQTMTISDMLEDGRALSTRSQVLLKERKKQRKGAGPHPDDSPDSWCVFGIVARVQCFTGPAKKGNSPAGDTGVSSAEGATVARGSPAADKTYLCTLSEMGGSGMRLYFTVDAETMEAVSGDEESRCLPGALTLSCIAAAPWP